VSREEEEHELPRECTKWFDETHLVQDLIHEEAPFEDEVLVSSLPFDEDIQAFVPPTHQEENKVSYHPFINVDGTLFYDFIYIWMEIPFMTSRESSR